MFVVFAVTLAEYFSTFGEIEAVKVSMCLLNDNSLMNNRCCTIPVVSFLLLIEHGASLCILLLLILH